MTSATARRRAVLSAMSRPTHANGPPGPSAPRIGPLPSVLTASLRGGTNIDGGLAGNGRGPCDDPPGEAARRRRRSCAPPAVRSPLVRSCGGGAIGASTSSARRAVARSSSSTTDAGGATAGSTTPARVVAATAPSGAVVGRRPSGRGRLAPPTEVRCAVCATTFVGRRADAVYCSPSCRQLAYRRRRAGRARRARLSLTRAGDPSGPEGMSRGPGDRVDRPPATGAQGTGRCSTSTAPSGRPRSTRPSWPAGRPSATTWPQQVSLARDFSGDPTGEGLVLKRGEALFATVSSVSLIEERERRRALAERIAGRVDPDRLARWPRHPLPRRRQPWALRAGHAGADRGRRRDRLRHRTSGWCSPGRAHTRECRFDKLLSCEPGAGSMNLSVSNRQKPTTLYYGTALDGWFGFRVTLALAHFRGDVPSLVAQLAGAARRARRGQAPPTPSP